MRAAGGLKEILIVICYSFGMNEEEITAQLISEGYDPVWVYEAEPSEIDEEHDHDFDTKLVILKGDIQIITVMNGVITNMKYTQGQSVEILRKVKHSAKVGSDGCRYVVAEKH
jgi:tellurite resistance-related uncharacterized protein